MNFLQVVIYISLVRHRKPYGKYKKTEFAKLKQRKNNLFIFIVQLSSPYPLLEFLNEVVFVIQNILMAIYSNETRASNITLDWSGVHLNIYCVYLKLNQPSVLDSFLCLRLVFVKRRQFIAFCFYDIKFSTKKYYAFNDHIMPSCTHINIGIILHLEVNNFVYVVLWHFYSIL